MSREFILFSKLQNCNFHLIGSFRMDGLNRIMNQRPYFIVDCNLMVPLNKINFLKAKVPWRGAGTLANWKAWSNWDSGFESSTCFI